MTLDRHECFSVLHHLQEDKQRKQRHSLKLGKKRRKTSKRNYYIISPRVIIKAIIIVENTVIGIVVVVIGHHNAHTDISMPIYDGGIREYIGFFLILSKPEERRRAEGH